MPVSLTETLKELIRRNGPITFHDWMKAALYDPSGGYYRRSDLQRWGRAGDYRTSPERSELFAVTFARYFAGLYERLERPARWTIVECGAGNGRFAFGVLRTLAERHPSVFDATRYVVQDVSNDALERARQTLVEFGERVQFCAELDFEVESGVYFSNELLDAFPVHRVVQDSEGLAELYVNVSAEGNFAWSNGPLSTPRLAEFVREHSLKLAPKQIVEINLAIGDWLARVARTLDRGFVVTVDYGAEADELYDPALRPEGSLRGFTQHRFVDDVLAQPGEIDITSSVNWTQVRTTGEHLGLKMIEFAPLDRFLMNAGILDELEYQIARLETSAEKLSLGLGAREMILPGGMASSFQVLVQQRLREGVGDGA